MFIDNYLKTEARIHALGMATYNTLIDEIEEQKENASDDATRRNLKNQRRWCTKPWTSSMTVGTRHFSDMSNYHTLTLLNDPQKPTPYILGLRFCLSRIKQ